jgi:hypothetical protein
MLSLGSTALKLAQRGLHVFPCWPRTKTPVTKHGWHDATTNPKRVQQWWESSPEFNVAIACAPSGIFVVDTDGLDAEAALARLEAAHTAIPPTVEATTSRGRHIYLRPPPDTVIGSSKGKLAPGIDIIANGYIVAPPSIHPCGRQYCWSVDCAGAIALAPDWIVKIANQSAGGGQNNGRGPRHTAAEWHRLVRDGAAEHTRNDTLTKLCGYFLSHRCDPGLVLEMLLSWNRTHCRPPLADDEVVKVVDSILRCELRQRSKA